MFSMYGHEDLGVHLFYKSSNVRTTGVTRSVIMILVDVEIVEPVVQSLFINFLLFIVRLRGRVNVGNVWRRVNVHELIDVEEGEMN